MPTPPPHTHTHIRGSRAGQCLCFLPAKETCTLAGRMGYLVPAGSPRVPRDSAVADGACRFGPGIEHGDVPCPHTPAQLVREPCAFSLRLENFSVWLHSGRWGFRTFVLRLHNPNCHQSSWLCSALSVPTRVAPRWSWRDSYSVGSALAHNIENPSRQAFDAFSKAGVLLVGQAQEVMGRPQPQ